METIEVTLNDTGEITGYAQVGGLIDSVEVEKDNIPDDFTDKFKPNLYIIRDEKIIENPDYVEPSEEIPETPSKLEQAVSQIMLSSAEQKVAQDKFNSAILLQIAEGKES